MDERSSEVAVMVEAVEVGSGEKVWVEEGTVDAIPITEDFSEDSSEEITVDDVEAFLAEERGPISPDDYVGVESLPEPLPLTLSEVLSDLLVDELPFDLDGEVPLNALAIQETPEVLELAQLIESDPDASFLIEEWLDDALETLEPEVPFEYQVNMVGLLAAMKKSNSPIFDTVAGVFAESTAEEIEDLSRISRELLEEPILQVSDA